MRTCLILLVCAIGLCMVSGCSDNSSPSAPAGPPEEPLAQINFDGNVGVTAPKPNYVTIVFASTSSDTLFNMHVAEADSGKVKTVTAFLNPEFRRAAARLSDGVDDAWWFWIWFPNGGGGGSSTTESHWLNGGY